MQIALCVAGTPPPHPYRIQDRDHRGRIGRPKHQAALGHVLVIGAATWNVYSSDRKTLIPNPRSLIPNLSFPVLHPASFIRVPSPDPESRVPNPESGVAPDPSRLPLFAADPGRVIPRSRTLIRNCSRCRRNQRFGSGCGIEDSASGFGTVESGLGTRDSGFRMRDSAIRDSG